MSRLKKSTEAIGRMPRTALIVVAIGLALSIVIFALRFTDIGLSAEEGWAVVESVELPEEARASGGGRLDLARTTIASIAPTERGDLLFRVSGTVVASSQKGPLTVRCDVAATDPATSIARTPQKRAAWPRPSEDLSIQEVPELMVISFSATGLETLGLGIRDSIRRYTDADALTTVTWDGFEENAQNWLWEIPKGTGGIPVTLGYAVVFKSTRRPSAVIECRASAPGQAGADLEARVIQDLWPIPAEGEETA